MRLSREEIARHESAIVESIRRIEELKRTTRERVAQLEAEAEVEIDKIQRTVFRSAEQLAEHAETTRVGKNATLSQTVTAYWYEAAARARELADIRTIYRELRRKRLVQLFLRKRTSYAVNKTAVKDNQALLKARGITTITVDEPRNLVRIEFDAIEAKVIKDLGSHSWQISWPEEKRPRQSAAQGSS